MVDEQKILVSINAENSNNFDVVILVYGAQIEVDNNVKRLITILDGRNEDDKKIARKRWKQANAQGHKTCYWQQDAHGRWVQPNI